MAVTSKSPVITAAAVLLLLIAAAGFSPASASTVRAYKGSCGGESIKWSCGCRNLAGYKGGFVFDYSGCWVGKFYYGSHCKGHYDSASRDVRRCFPHDYKSVYIPC